MNKDPLKVISAKDLGALALPDFCARCFWFERHVSKPPSIFPGIFSTLDSVTKKGTRRAFSSKGEAPAWVPISNIKRQVVGSLYLEQHVKWGDWTLTGYPDDVFELIDGTYHIADYKVARFTQTQDKLFPMYEVQLNGYALMAPTKGMKPISALTLVYCEPNAELEDHDRFLLEFTTNPKSVEIKSGLIPEFLIKAREILNNPKPPTGNFGCQKTCNWLNKAIEKGGNY